MTDATPTQPVNPVPASPSSPVKPGWKTTEFYFKLLAILLSALFATNAIPTGSVAMKLAMIAATMLGALGYTVSRTMIKTAAMLCLIAFGLHASAGCGASSRATTIADTVHGLDAAGAALHAYGPPHELQLAQQATSAAAGEKALADWQSLRSKLELGLEACYRALAVAEDDKKLQAATAQAAAFYADLTKAGVIGGGK